jgi:hypothetical protein
MSVPLDRLYKFLYDIANHDNILIYVFLPHGSRNLTDISSLPESLDSNEIWKNTMIKPCMIVHDQEPLMYHLYSKNDFVNYLEQNRHKLYPKALIDIVAELHLRACVHSTTNVYDQTLLCHSEQNSQDLDLYQQHGFIGVYYWSHALIARDWYRHARLDLGLAVNFEHITHDFLIYNRAWSGTREYRLILTEMLANNDLLSCCKMSFSAVDNQLQYSQHKFINPNLVISRDDLHELLPANTHDATASADYNNNDYTTTAIEVVLETLFDDRRHHLTEKTLRPIACGKPFILASTPGSLQYLKQYGFKTFDGLIDETYDTIVDPRERLVAIVKEVKRISGLDHVQKKSLWHKLYAIADHNKQLFFSEEWHNLIVREFKNNFDSAINQLTVSGKYQDKLDEIAANNDPEMLHWRKLNLQRPGKPTPQDRIEVAQWIQEFNLQKAQSLST